MYRRHLVLDLHNSALLHATRSSLPTLPLCKRCLDERHLIITMQGSFFKIFKRGLFCESTRLFCKTSRGLLCVQCA